LFRSVPAGLALAKVRQQHGADSGLGRPQVERVSQLVVETSSAAGRLRGDCRTSLVVPFAFLFRHYRLGPLVQLVLGECQSQFHQKLLVNGLQIVVRHALHVDDGVQYVVHVVQALLRSKFVKHLREAHDATAVAPTTTPVGRGRLDSTSRSPPRVFGGRQPVGVQETPAPGYGHFGEYVAAAGVRTLLSGVAILRVRRSRTNNAAAVAHAPLERRRLSDGQLESLSAAAHIAAASVVTVGRYRSYRRRDADVVADGLRTRD